MRAPVAALLVVAGLLWIVGSNAWSGPVVMVLSEHHGVHLHDWLSVVLWGGALLSRDYVGTPTTSDAA